MRVFMVNYSRYGNVIKHLMLDQQQQRLLIDTRSNPQSQMPEWCCEALQATYGERYRPAGGFLGNENYQRKGAPIKIAKPNVGIRGLLLYLREGYELVLICGCPQYERCHLKEIVALLCQAAPAVEIVIAGEAPLPGMVAALSGTQPYQHLLLHPELLEAAGLPPKRLTNRNWTTAYKGPVVLHASKKFDAAALPGWSRRLGYDLTALLPKRKDYDQGFLVGQADLVEVVEQSSDPWFIGRYGFVLRHPQVFSRPIPYRGAAGGLFYIPLTVLEEGAVI